MESEVNTQFTLSERSFKKFFNETKRKTLMAAAPPFSPEEMNEAAKLKRREAAKGNYWAFREIYFPNKMFRGGFFEPAPFHHDLLEISERPGMQLVLGGRKTGKTAQSKAKLAYDLLEGRILFAGTMSQTLNKSTAILFDLWRIIAKNPRILYDYAPEFSVANSDEFVFELPDQSELRTVRAYSEGRSVRGETETFDRPQFILCDDIETRDSPRESKQIDNRIRFLSETLNSLEDNGTLLVLGNNFDQKSAMNRLKTESEQGILSGSWSVHVYPSFANGQSIWMAKYPANTEAQARAHFKPYDDSEWSGDYQQNPVPPEGKIFKRILHTYKVLPPDAVGVMWCDPNLSKKGLGDSTAIGALLFSPSTKKYYLAEVSARSYSDPTKLLNDVLAVRRKLSGRIATLGWDGNVSQESTWTALTNMWIEIQQQPYTRQEYRRYVVDYIYKTPAADWNSGNILVPEDVMATEEGREFMEHIFTFAGKAANLPDDGADLLISAYELIQEIGIPRRGGHDTSESTVRTVSDNSFF